MHEARLQDGVRWLPDPQGRAGEPPARTPVIGAILATDDRSTGSGALARALAAIDPGLLAAEGQAFLLDGLALPMPCRALVVGSPNGALARALADRGATVEVIEADPHAAAVTGARLLGVAGATTWRASTETWVRQRHVDDGTYDLIVLMDGPAGPVLRGRPRTWDLGPTFRFLATLLAPDGIVVTRLERRSGMGRLLVGPAALEPAPDGPETRAQLEALLDAAGLTARRALTVLPELATPEVLVADEPWDRPDGREAIGVLVRHPVRVSAGARPSLDPHATFRAWLDQGIARELADSCLVIAARTADALARLGDEHARVLPDPMLASDWRATWILAETPEGYRLEPVDPAPPVSSGPLTWRAVDRVVAGRAGDGLLADSILREGPDGTTTTALLGAWWAAVLRDLDGPDGRALDVGPAWCRVADDDAWTLERSGLTARFPIPTEVLAADALFELVLDRVLPAGVPPGLSASETVTDLVGRLAAGAGVVFDGATATLALDHRIDRRLRTGVTAGDRRAERRAERRRRQAPLGEAIARQPLARIVADAARAIEAEARLERALAQLAQREAELDEGRARFLEAERIGAERADAERAVKDELAFLKGANNGRGQELVVARARLDALEEELTRLRELEAARAPGAADPAAARVDVTPPPAPAPISAAPSAPTPSVAAAPTPVRVAAPVPPRPRPQPIRRSRASSLRDRVTEPWRARAVDRSGLFDGTWYRSRYPDVAASGMEPLRHYVRHGWIERRDPGPGFDVAAYLQDSPDVAAAGIDPVLHYARHGREEGRRTQRVDADAASS